VKIAINTRFLLPGRTLEGIARYTYEISKNLVLSHPEHEFYFFFDRPYDKACIFSENVIPIVIRPAARHAILFYLWFEWQLPRYLKKYKIDLFFSTDNFLSLRTSCPTILTVHDLAFLHYPDTIPLASRLYYKYFMPKFLKKATHLLPVSFSVKMDILQNYNINDKKISVVYNALPSAFLNLPQITNDVKENYFVLAGSINPRKNTYKILQSFEEFCQKVNCPFKLKLIGNFMGNNDKALSHLMDRLQDKGVLIHLKNLDDNQMINEIRTAKALLYISKFEGFGIPILEAMACGTPVITSNVASMPEVAGNAALLVNPHNQKEIVAAMLKIVANNELAEDLIKKGRLQIKNFSYKDSAQQVYLIMEKVYNAHLNKTQ
jgi:glycosyltransferase involved in cell wall biosynthesis